MYMKYLELIENSENYTEVESSKGKLSHRGGIVEYYILEL